MSISFIKEDYASFGLPRYFVSDRCFNTKSLQEFNKGKIKAKELVTFDCGLMELREIEAPEWNWTEYRTEHQTEYQTESQVENQNQNQINSQVENPIKNPIKNPISNPIDNQILAVIVRPGIEPNAVLEKKCRFTFCGYDLVEIDTTISAITNCGVLFPEAIDYSDLNPYGLFSSYRKAVNAQLELHEKYPDENHAYCEIVEIWRRLPNQEMSC